MIELPAWARVSAERRAHIDRVSSLLEVWAGELGTPTAERERWRRAASLHDALRDASADTLASYTADPWGIAALWHGPAAAAAAEGAGETDRSVLEAVRFHSVGYAGWDEVGRMLYLADYLEPGRSFEREARTALAARVPQDPRAVLREVARRRLIWLLGDGAPLLPETVGFWNALWASAARSR